MAESIITGGYILLSRKIIESKIWDKPPLYLKVWIWLLEKAQHKEYKNLKRGQLYCQIEDIQKGVGWYVGYRKETPTKDQIFQILDWMRKCHEGGNESNARATMIATTKATHGLLINISNYSHYQNPKNYESNDEGNDEKVTKAEREQRQADNINKECSKNVENDNISIDDFFQTIWQMYPNKKGKANVKKTQKEKLFKFGIEALTKCIERYKETKPEWKEWQHGSTFFNSGYVDYLDENYTEEEDEGYGTMLPGGGAML